MSLATRLAAAAATALLSLASAPAFAQALNAPAIAQARAAGIFDDKASRTVAEKKLAANLLFTQRAMQRGARRHSVTSGVPGFVQDFIDSRTDANLATFVAIRATFTAELAAWLPTIGATGIAEFAQYGRITATVPVASLLVLAARPEVTFVGERELVRTNRYFPQLDPKRKAMANAITAVPNVGPVTWQGVTAHRADVAHQAGFTGADVKVCVISDGVDSLGARQLAGELPPVDVLPTQAGAGDEGTAMLEIVHDMAPGASLGFATGTNDPAVMANNIRQLQASKGCHIIVDDVSWIFEAAFNDDIIAAAVNDVTAAGAIYFASAGNWGNLTYGHSGTFEGDFLASAVPMPGPIADIETPSAGSDAKLHMFPSGLEYTSLVPGTLNDGRTDVITLKWSDASNTSVNDYDLFVMDSTSMTMLGMGINFQGTDGHPPYEQATCDVTREALSSNGTTPSPCDLDATHTCSTASSKLFCVFPTGARIYVVRYAGAPRAINLETFGGVISGPDRTTGSTFGHNAAASALTVGATTLAGVLGSNSFSTQNKANFYSSDGPRKLFYNNNSGTITPITPGNLLFATIGGTTVPKVDLTAADCGATSTPDFDVFCGTSAAAPTAAAIAALVKSAKPAATRSEITTALLNSAITVESTTVNTGAGIVMAQQAVLGVLLPLTYGKAFLPSAITVGNTSTLTITIGNPNSVAISEVVLSDHYPTHVVNAMAPNAMVAGAGCSATLQAFAGGGDFTILHALIPANTTCTFTVAVTAMAGGIYVDNQGAIGTPLGMGANSPSVTLTVDAPSVQRAFVSAFGSDANTASYCGIMTPCRSFAAAQLVLLPGGEIIALNAAGYGAITITKSLSIIANPGFYAGITAASGDAITIATAGMNVLLRGLNMNGTGGANGVNLTASNALVTLDNCVIANFTASGVKVDASGATVRLANTVLSGNAVDGLQVAQGRADVIRSRAIGNGRGGFAAFTVSPGALARVSIVESFASGNTHGFLVNAPAGDARMNATRVTGAGNTTTGARVVQGGGVATAVISGGLFTQNATGLDNNNGGTLKTPGDNLVDLNGSNIAGPITALTPQ